jgi:thioredoxin 1
VYSFIGQGLNDMKSIPAIVIVMCCGTVLLVGCPEQTPPGENNTDASSAQVMVLDESNFDSELETGVVLVDFWATWCPPCKIQGPIVDKVAAQVQDSAKVAKLDVDAAPAIAQRFNIQSIPTLIIFKDGKNVQQFVGVTDADKLVSAIRSLSAPNS